MSVIDQTHFTKEHLLSVKMRVCELVGFLFAELHFLVNVRYQPENFNEITLI